MSVEADTVHADTQGQSAAVFAFTHLLGINLMPRIRNWQDLKLYRASSGRAKTITAQSTCMPSPTAA